MSGLAALDLSIRAWHVHRTGSSAGSSVWHGRVPANRCRAARCDGDERVADPSGWRCGTCGARWPTVAVHIPVAELGGSLGPDVEERWLGFLDLGRALEAMERDPSWRSEVRCFLAWCLTGASLEQIAEHANLYQWVKKRGKVWTERAVRAGRDRARAEVARRLSLKWPQRA